MNNNNNILLIDPAFDPASSSACNLLVKVGTDHLSYAIINKETKQVYVVFDQQECEDGTLKLAERLKTDPYLTLAYQEIKTAIHTDNVISIPNEVYNETSLNTHAKFLTGANYGNLYAQSLSHFGFTSIFALPKATDQILSTHLTNPKRYQHNAGLFALAENIAGTALFLDFSVGSLHTLYVKDQQVVFQQCYEIANIEEFNYYLLLMINQLHIDPKETDIHLAGIIHEGDEKYNCLLKYFTSIQFINITNEPEQEILDEMPLHYYSSLLALDLCV